MVGQFSAVTESELTTGARLSLEWLEQERPYIAGGAESCRNGGAQDGLARLRGGRWVQVAQRQSHSIGPWR